MPLIDELKQQPAALRQVVEVYRQNTELLDLGKRLPAQKIILTGMGASYHAARIASFHLNRLGISSTAVEAADFLSYNQSEISQDTLVVYISQSGSSGEVPYLLERLGGPAASLVSITNNPGSTLALGANLNLPMEAGKETLIASKTYLNTLAILWLVARRLASIFDGSEFASLEQVAGLVANQFENAEAIASKLETALEGQNPPIILGYGPHGVTARQAAMILSEWAKTPVLHYSAGAFRHGFIEIVEPGCAVVIISPPESVNNPACELARELQKYGARVLMVENGKVCEPGENTGGQEPLDEFLSPILDIVPFQIYAEALAPRRGFGKGFRYISKIVTKL